MGRRATGTFDIRGWKEEPYDEREETRLVRNVEGESVAELLMAYGTEENSAAYVGFERSVGRVHGRASSFLLLHAVTEPAGRAIGEGLRA